MRKTKTVLIEREGRDKGKSFLITEMPADQAERWAMRALLGMMRSGVQLPDEALSAGMAAISSYGLQMLAGLPEELFLSLMDEMMACVQYVQPIGGTRPLMEGEGADIEELSTRITLRRAVLELHLGFSLPAAPSISGSVGTTPAQPG